MPSALFTGKRSQFNFIRRKPPAPAPSQNDAKSSPPSRKLSITLEPQVLTANEAEDRSPQRSPGLRLPLRMNPPLLPTENPRSSFFSRAADTSIPIYNPMIPVRIQAARPK